jgi:signal transduction histidine kinase
MRWSLRRRLALVILTAALVPSAILTAYVYPRVRASQIESVLKQLDSIAAVQEARIEAALDGDLHTILPLIESRPSLVETLWALQQPGGSSERAKLAAYLQDICETIPSLRNAYLLTPGGEILAMAIPVNGLGALIDPLRAIGGLRENVQGPLFLNSSYEVVNVVAGPMVRDGATIGMVVLETSTLASDDMIGDYTGLGRSGETVLAMPDPQGDALFIQPTRFDPNAAMTRHISGENSRSPIIRALNGFEGVSADSVDYREVAVFSASRYLEGPGWGLVVKMDVTEALAAVTHLRMVLTVGIAAAICIALGVAFLGVRSVRRPILDLTGVVTGIAGGQLEKRAAVTSQDELGLLALSFNEMADALVTERQNLEARVAERTEDLKQAAQRLRELVQSKADLVASVSHELRTPLTVLVGYINELSDRWESFSPEETQEILAIAAHQANQLAEMVEDLLVAARTEAGQLSVCPAEVDLHSLAEEVTRDLETGSVIAGRGDSEACWAWADPVRVRQIVRNLLTNASRYGGKSVIVEVDSGATEAHLSVRDDGPGLPEDQWELIFEMYQRGDGRAATPGSVGIGLTISRHLARLMGGDLRYRYQEGQSVFELTLPAIGTASPSSSQD